MRDAFYEDIFTVLRLVGVCFGTQGIAGCICKFISTLEPEWRKVSTSEAVRCETGDPFGLIVAQLNTQIIDWTQWGVNLVEDGVNGFVQNLPWPLDFVNEGPFARSCFPDPRRPRKCEGGGMTAAESRTFDECENEAFKGGLDLTCYYHRVRAHTHIARPVHNTNSHSVCACR